MSPPPLESEKKEVSFFKTCINGINALSGIGILSVPYALSSGGWLSLIIFVLMAAAACFTAILIRRCMDKDPTTITSYIDIVGHAFGLKGRVLLLSFVICTITYLTMAVLGYLIYGQNVQSQVTLNLPTEHVSSKVAIYTILAGPIAKYALTTLPIAIAFENRLPASYKDYKSASILIRTSLLVSSVVLAAVFPLFLSVTSLIGAFLSVVVSFLLPCVCYLKIFEVYRN